MRIIGYIVQKEFKQIFRNRAMLPIIFVLPLIQLIILAHAATFEVRNIKLAFVDHDHSSLSRALMHKFDASQSFVVSEDYPAARHGQQAILAGEVDVVIEIPTDFERKLVREQHTDIGVRIDAINAAAAGITNVYVNQIIADFNRTAGVIETATHTGMGAPVIIRPVVLYWFNTDLDYKIFMVPGILVLLVTMISLFLSAMNIVREKEIGTLEQINVTPIKRHQFVIGKLLPFWILGLVVLTIGLIVGRVVFDVPVIGSVALIYLFTALYMILILGMGLFISNFTNTQQQAMFIAWFFMVIFVLMSGLFTPIESMPGWAQGITGFNPIRYYVEIIRMVMLKGSGLHDVLPQFGVVAGYAVLMNILAIVSYRKVT